MATIGDAVAAGKLVVFTVPDWETRLPIRPLWVTPELLQWADNTPDLHDLRLGVGGRTMFEHLEQFLCDFRCSKQLHAGDLKRMLPNKKGVWKMHPFGLRIYGWAPAAHQFAAVTWARVEDTKADKSLNDAKRDEVLEFVRANGLLRTIMYGDINAVFPRST